MSWLVKFSRINNFTNSKNFKFRGDLIPFLGDTLILGKDENRPDSDFKLAINTSLSKRLDKIKKTIILKISISPLY